MEIAAKAGVVSQGSTPQPDGKVTTSQEDIQVAVGNATAGGVTDTSDSGRSDDVVINEVQSKDTIRRAVDEINKKTNTEAVWGVHDETNRITIKIVDKETKKVIREYPPEETLDMIAKVWEMAGILVDEKR